MKRFLALLLLVIFSASVVSGGSSIIIVDSPSGTYQMSVVDDETFVLNFKANIGGTTPSDPYDFKVFYYESTECSAFANTYDTDELGDYLGEFFSTADWSSGENIAVEFNSLSYDPDRSTTDDEEGENRPYTCYLIRARFRTDINSELSDIFGIQVYRDSLSVIGNIREKLPAPPLWTFMLPFLMLIPLRRIQRT